ncbi:YhcN/YlaJ family sporulation lipoprotein [Aneurinibacillus thermoaerophilus]|uniref:YhcN/YlaJ family sporulation lipoprotein n=1 Tax=Aneurinibacillus thermoaerophilus TaxID=143495 RepID=UPI002E225209|nr:YhcN/YlaJ family sporulation lipoprotein [Aneurinibacillus thermoaerophilus]MED0766351.1 YhcN/YlaJ family sporulation lipoprotein [Aneurinibacillus thermoaerophilus]
MIKALKKLTVVSLVTIMASSIVACTQGAAPNNPNRTKNYRVNEYQPYTTTPRHYDGLHPYGTPYHGVHPYGTYTPQPSTGLHPYNTAAHNRAVADRMANAATKVVGVTRATAVVSGRDAVIGLDINNVTKSKTTIEREVAKAVKAAEPGYNVHVTTDGALHQRIRALSDQTRAGHPVRTLTHDVGMLIRDIGRSVTAPFR